MVCYISVVKIFDHVLEAIGLGLFMFAVWIVQYRTLYPILISNKNSIYKHMSITSQLSSILREMTSRRTLNQMWKFGTIGLFGAGINLGLLTLFVEVFDWFYLYAAVIAIICAGASNFTLNKFFTFDDKKKSHQDKDRS